MNNIKEKKIEYLKLWLTFLVTIDVGLIAWFFNNIMQMGIIRLIICLVPLILISIFIPFIHIKTYKLIKSLGD